MRYGIKIHQLQFKNDDVKDTSHSPTVVNTKFVTVYVILIPGPFHTNNVC